VIDETLKVLSSSTPGARFEPRGIRSVGVSVELIEVYLELVRLLEDIGDLLGEVLNLGLPFVSNVLSSSERELFRQEERWECEPWRLVVKIKKRGWIGDDCVRLM